MIATSVSHQEDYNHKSNIGVWPDQEDCVSSACTHHRTMEGTWNGNLPEDLLYEISSWEGSGEWHHWILEGLIKYNGQV